MEKLERYLRFIREAERLKDVLRTAHTSTGRHERPNTLGGWPCWPPSSPANAPGWTCNEYC